MSMADTVVGHGNLVQQMKKASNLFPSRKPTFWLDRSGLHGKGLVSKSEVETPQSALKRLSGRNFVDALPCVLAATACDL